MEGFAELHYPTDFTQLTTDQSDPNKIMLKTTDIELSDAFNIDTHMKYDFPYSNWELSLFEAVTSEDNQATLDIASTQLPILVDQGDIYTPTMLRELKSNDLKGKRKYILAWSDELALKVFGYISTKNPDQ